MGNLIRRLYHRLARRLIWRNPPIRPTEEEMNMYQPPTQPPPARKRMHPVALAAVVILATIIGSSVIAGTIGSLSTTASPETTNVPAVDTSSPETSEPVTEETTEPAVEETPDEAPSPDGSFVGSCDYELGEFMADDYALTGEIDAENTGNVGIVVRLKITWPQFGHEPIKAVKKVRLSPGDTKTVRFRRAASGTEIDRIQSWQLNHGYEDGCKYRGSIIDTFGEVRG